MHAKPAQGRACRASRCLQRAGGCGPPGGGPASSGRRRRARRRGRPAAVDGQAGDDDGSEQTKGTTHVSVPFSPFLGEWPDGGCGGKRGGSAPKEERREYLRPAPSSTAGL